MNEAEFDKFADEYHAQHTRSIRLSGEEPDFFAQYKVAEMARQIERAPTKILDFGGGIGNSLGHLKAQFPQSNVTLCDPSLRSLEIAKERFPAQGNFVQITGLPLPFADDEFDLILAACVFHHIDPTEHGAIITELSRILAPGGSFFLFEHNPFNPLTRKAVSECEFDKDAILVSSRQAKRSIRGASFQTVKTRFRIFFPRMLSALRFLEPALGFLPIGGQYFVQATK